MGGGSQKVFQGKQHHLDLIQKVDEGIPCLLVPAWKDWFFWVQKNTSTWGQQGWHLEPITTQYSLSLNIIIDIQNILTKV